ncbi:hypothetical protein ACFWG6_02355 [Streptomyces erythrochromogenes]|uniref:hypothetical protein n=1 Tax=Streptomyces erythrochromogenes TaxID=285574 RepID=UPI00363B5771
MPGPFYDDEWGAEFVYRQPRDTAQALALALALLGAVAQEPMAGYACDGDDHWTAELVRDWRRNARRPTGAGSTLPVP